jgi:HlyD family secretion protein
MGQNTLAGRVEATLIAHASEVQGKIIQVPVSLGETVKAGDIIAIIDSTQQKYALEQLKQVLLQKQSALNLLEKAADDETTKQAQNQVTVAQAAYGSAQAAYANAKAAYNTSLNNYEKAKSDYEAYSILYQDGGISASEYENIKLAFTAAANAKETAQNNMNIAQNSVNAAQAQADSTKQQLNNIYEGSDDDTLVAAAAAVAPRLKAKSAQLRIF